LVTRHGPPSSFRRDQNTDPGQGPPRLLGAFAFSASTTECPWVSQRRPPVRFDTGLGEPMSRRVRTRSAKSWRGGLVLLVQGCQHTQSLTEDPRGYATPRALASRPGRATRSQGVDASSASEVPGSLRPERPRGTGWNRDRTASLGEGCASVSRTPCLLAGASWPMKFR
jgi:hypothetical protein